MRILYVWQATYPWEIRVKKITESLAKAGYEVTVLARKRYCSDADEEILEHDVRVLRVGRRLSPAISGSPIWSRAIGEAIRRVQPNAMVVRDIPLIVNAVRAATKHRIPLVLDMAEHYPGAMRMWRKYQENPLSRVLVHRLRIPDRLERWGAARVDLIWVVCREQVARLQREYGVPAEKLVEVGNTPALDWFSRCRKGCSVPPLVLGHHGHMTPERGLALLIEAFAKVCPAFPGLTLELAGQGETTTTINAMIHDRGIRSRVRMLGAYVHSDLDELYSRIDVAVLPYPPGDLTDNTLSNKIFDYMACGKPIVTSGAAPMRRLMRETGAGISFEPWTSEALAAELTKLLSRTDGLAPLSASGMKAYAEQYNWDQDASRMLASLQALAARR